MTELIDQIKVELLKLSDIKEGDAIIIHYPEDIYLKMDFDSFLHDLCNAASKVLPENILIIPIAPSITIETLPEEEMNKHGWIKRA